jgi:hypothetical protein
VNNSLLPSSRLDFGNKEHTICGFTPHPVEVFFRATTNPECVEPLILSVNTDELVEMVNKSKNSTITLVIASVTFLPKRG